MEHNKRSWYEEFPWYFFNVGCVKFPSFEHYWSKKWTLCVSQVMPRNKFKLMLRFWRNVDSEILLTHAWVILCFLLINKVIQCHHLHSQYRYIYRWINDALKGTCHIQAIQSGCMEINVRVYSGEPNSYIEIPISYIKEELLLWIWWRTSYQKVTSCTLITLQWIWISNFHAHLKHLHLCYIKKS